MKYLILFVPVIFSAVAQLFVKAAARHELKTTQWFIFIGMSLVAYVVAFILYSFAVREFPLSVASPVNTIAVMVIVFILAALLFGEVISLQKAIGIGLGLISILLLLTAQ
jgi:drug/metabolite transporter (DMT)-like permease